MKVVLDLHNFMYTGVFEIADCDVELKYSKFKIANPI